MSISKITDANFLSLPICVLFKIHKHRHLKLIHKSEKKLRLYLPDF